VSRRGHWKISLTMLLGIAILLLALSIWVGSGAAQHMNGSPCDNPPSRVSPKFPYPLPIVVLVCGAALLGRLAGYLRAPATRPRGSAGTATSAAGWRLALAQFWVAFFLLVCAALLAFETFTLAVGIWPITFYVRCANDYLPLPTIAGACLTAFLLGHWLWFPSRDE
jgi:hypothetical protein